MNKTIDSTDKKILYELNWNARQSINQLAKKLRVSKQVANYRIKKLEEQKIIKGYHAIIDWRTLGYNALRIYIRWKNIKPQEEEHIYKEINKKKLFMWAVKFEGDVDIGVYAWINNMTNFAKEWKQFMKEHKHHIHTYEIYESINMIHYPMKFLTNKKNNNKKITIGEGNKTTYDNKDYEILQEITKNARIPIIELAKKIKLTTKTTLKKIRNLEKKKIILGYYTLIDTEKIGWHFYKIDFYLNNLNNIEQLEEYAQKQQNTVYQMNTIGGPDFEIELAVQNVNDMKKIINDIRKKHGENINKYRIHRFEYTLKQTYLPGKE